MSGRAEDAGRRGQLLRESARLFREKGYDATSVRDIAAATGLQSGSWVYHFKTKQDILAAVMEQGLQQALERIEAIAREELPPREHFRALVRTHLDTLLGPGQDFIPVLLYDWRSLDRPGRGRVIALQKRYEQVWGEVIGKLQRSGEWAMPTRRMGDAHAHRPPADVRRPQLDRAVVPAARCARRHATGGRRRAVLPAHAGPAFSAGAGAAPHSSVARLNVAAQ